MKTVSIIQGKHRTYVFEKLIKNISVIAELLSSCLHHDMNCLELQVLTHILS